MKKAALCFQPSVSLKNASTLVTLCLMGVWHFCPLAIGHSLGKVVIINTNWAMRKVGLTNQHTHIHCLVFCSWTFISFIYNLTTTHRVWDSLETAMRYDLLMMENFILLSGCFQHVKIPAGIAQALMLQTYATQRFEPRLLCACVRSTLLLAQNLFLALLTFNDLEKKNNHRQNSISFSNWSLFLI